MTSTIQQKLRANQERRREIVRQLAEQKDKEDSLGLETRLYGHNDEGYSLVAFKDGKRVGSVTYSGGSGSPIYIESISTEKNMQRKGVASLMARQLANANPGDEIRWGAGTESGAPFVESVKRWNALRKEFADIREEDRKLECRRNQPNLTA